MADAQEAQVTGLYRSIHAQPQAVRDLLADGEVVAQAAEKLARADRIFVSGIGTSFHAATVGEYLLRYAGADAWAVRSFELVHYPRPLRKGDAVIVISHRGSKLHGMLAVERALASGGVSIGITGKNSKMQDMQFMLTTVEQDPSSTHSISYTGALTRLAQLAARLASLRGNAGQAQRLERGLGQIPGLMEDILSREDDVRRVADEAAAYNRRLYYLGAGPNSVTGPEGALKAKEAAYVTAEGFELEQGIHGPQVAFEQEDLLIPISVRGPAQSRMADLLLALHEIGSRAWLIGEAPSAETVALFEGERWQAFSLGVYQSLPEELTPMLTVLPVQLLAEFLAAARGTNADSFRADQEPYKRAGQRFRI
ncbi:MAG TPA: SIS domain-containing protein [Ktedonobacteraceae bacterium]|nr:SIS domain-containing protein [Ktedonobacteraceae bacterium]